VSAGSTYDAVELSQTLDKYVTGEKAG